MTSHGATLSLHDLDRSANLVVLPISVTILISVIAIGLSVLSAEQVYSFPLVALILVLGLALWTFVTGAQSAFHAREFLSARGQRDQRRAGSERCSAAWWERYYRISLIALGLGMLLCCTFGFLYTEKSASAWVLLGICALGLFAYTFCAWICWNRFQYNLKRVLDPP